MIPEKLKQIISVLKDKTIANKAIWNKTSGDDEYKLKIGQGSSIVVSIYYGNYDRPFTSIAVYNQKGEMVERYNTEEEEDAQSIKLLTAFHKAARDSYYNVDETMDSLLAEISKEDVVGTADSTQAEDEIDEDADLPF